MPATGAREALEPAALDPAAVDPAALPLQERLGAERETERERVRLYQVERELLARRSGVLLPAGHLVLEPSFNYTRFSRNRFQVNGFEVLPALFIGAFDISEIERDIYTTALSARYGLSDRMELEINVPYVLRRDQSILGQEGSERVERLDGNGVGDLTVNLATHLLQEDRGLPDAILNLRAKFKNGADPFESSGGQLPVGSGFWSVSSGLTLVKAADPAVFFASANYFANLERKIGGNFGTIDPGNTFELGLGLSFALNERMALSFSYQQRITGRALQRGTRCSPRLGDRGQQLDPPEAVCSSFRGKLERSGGNSSSLLLGTSYAVAPGMTGSLSLGIGLTKDAPDLALEMRVVKHFSQVGPSLRELGGSRLNPLRWFRGGATGTASGGRQVLSGGSAQQAASLSAESARRGARE